MDKRTPSELARNTLKLLASRKLPPTPDNYAHIYAEIGGLPAEKTMRAAEKPAVPAATADAAGNILQWSGLIRRLLRQLETTHKGLPITHKKEGVEKVLSRFGSKPEVLFEKLEKLLRSWSESPVATNLAVNADDASAHPPDNLNAATASVAAAAPAGSAPSTPPAKSEEAEMRQTLLRWPRKTGQSDKW